MAIPARAQCQAAIFGGAEALSILPQLLLCRYCWMLALLTRRGTEAIASRNCSGGGSSEGAPLNIFSAFASSMVGAICSRGRQEAGRTKSGGRGGTRCSTAGERRHMEKPHLPAGHRGALGVADSSRQQAQQRQSCRYLQEQRQVLQPQVLTAAQHCGANVLRAVEPRKLQEARGGGGGAAGWEHNGRRVGARRQPGPGYQRDAAALYCASTALHCTALHCTALHCPALPCPALHCTALPCPPV